MADTVVTTGKLGRILEKIDTIVEPENAFGTLYVSEGEDESSLNEVTFCAVLLITNEDAMEYVPEFAQKNNLQVLMDLWLAKDIVKQARSRKPDASTYDLVLAIKYYLNNDAYISYDELRGKH